MISGIHLGEFRALAFCLCRDPVEFRRARRVSVFGETVRATGRVEVEERSKKDLKTGAKETW